LDESVTKAGIPPTEGRASRGKAVRAEPGAVLFEKGKVSLACGRARLTAPTRWQDFHPHRRDDEYSPFSQAW
jgi:phage terminase large subunit-like protein